MTDKATLLALAERCEKATGPNRFIDNDIAAAMSDWKNLGGYWEEHKVTGERRQTSYPSPPAYTSSLDAAMTLVPEGAKVTTQTFGGPGAMALVDPNHRFCSAATPALALTAACLRARAA